MKNAKAVVGVVLALAGAAMIVAGLAQSGGDAPAATPSPSPSPTATPSRSPATGAGGPAATAAAANRPPAVGAIIAVLQPPNTSYTVEASDPDGDALTYAWTRTSTCGSFTAQGRVAVWGHPHPPCGEEEFHAGTIRVVVGDGKTQVAREYTRGSLSGTGAVPAATAASTPGVTATPAPTSAPAAAPTAAPPPVRAPGPNVPLVLGGLVVGAIGGGLLLWGRPGRLIERREEESRDPCADEKRREADARARRDAARRRRERMDGLRRASEDARRELERAEREHARLTDERTTSWGQVDGGPRIYTNKDHAASVERAEAALAAARAANDAARSAYDAAGDGAEHAAAGEAASAAEREWEDADAALQRCLQLNAPPPPPAPPARPAPPPAPPAAPEPPRPPVSAAPGGPTVATPPRPEPTRERACPEGTERARPGASATTRQVAFADLRNAKIKFSSDTRMITDFPLDDFIDWAQFTKDTFFALRKIASLSEGLGPDAGIPVGGALDLAGLPDFLTYYDKLIDEALKALKRTGEIQARLAKNGDYWLEYTRKRYTLRCEPWERCSGGRWVPFGKFSVTYDGDEPAQTQRLQALGDHRTIEREVQRVIDRLFRQLEQQNHAAESATRSAQGACGG